MRQNSRPIGQFRLNRDSPLSKGLIFWMPLIGYDYVDRVGGIAMAYAGVGKTLPEMTIDGPIVKFFNSPSAYLLSSSLPVGANLPLTISCWCNPIALASRTLVSIAAASNTTDFYALSLTVGGNARAQNNDTTGNSSATSANTYAAGLWNHVCGVYSGPSNKAIFLNGTGKGTSTTTRNPASLSRIGIGNIASSTPSAIFEGDIAHVCIWNRQFSDEEIAYAADPNNKYELTEQVNRKWIVMPAAGRTYADTLALARTDGITQSQIFTFLESQTLMATKSLTPSTTVAATEAPTLASTKAIARVNNVGVFEASTIGSTKAVVGVNSTGVVEAATLPSTKVLGGSGRVAVVEAPTLASAKAYSTQGGIAFVESVAIGSSKMVAIGNSLFAYEASTMSRALALATSDRLASTEVIHLLRSMTAGGVSMVSARESTVLSHASAITSVDTISITDVLNLGRSDQLSITYSVRVNEAITLHSDRALIIESLIAAAEALQLYRHIALAEADRTSYGRLITLTKVLGLFVTPHVISATLDTPHTRIYFVPSEGRVWKIEKELRTDIVQSTPITYPLP